MGVLVSTPPPPELLWYCEEVRGPWYRNYYTQVASLHWYPTKSHLTLEVANSSPVSLWSTPSGAKADVSTPHQLPWAPHHNLLQKGGLAPHLSSPAAAFLVLFGWSRVVCRKDFYLARLPPSQFFNEKKLIFIEVFWGVGEVSTWLLLGYSFLN